MARSVKKASKRKQKDAVKKTSKRKPQRLDDEDTAARDVALLAARNAACRKRIRELEEQLAGTKQMETRMVAFSYKGDACMNNFARLRQGEMPNVLYASGKSVCLSEALGARQRREVNSLLLQLSSRKRIPSAIVDLLDNWERESLSGQICIAGDTSSSTPCRD